MRVRSTEDVSGYTDEAEGDWIWDIEDFQEGEERKVIRAINNEDNIQYLPILNPVSLLLEPLRQEIWGSYQITNIGENVFPFVTLAKVKRIQFKKVKAYFQNLNKAQLLGSICSIRFTELKMLNLGQNFIKNLEKIQKMDAVHLQVLILQKNQIQQIKTLRKCHFPNLNKLNIMRNPIIDYWYLGQMELKSLKLLELQHQTYCDYRKQWIIGNRQYLPINWGLPDYTSYLHFKIGHKIAITDIHPNGIMPTVMENERYRKMISDRV